MTDTNRWELLSREEKLEVLDLPFGWMLRNILQYGNTLIPKEAIQKSSVKMIKAAMEQDLSDLGFDANVRIKVYPRVIARGMDYIAEAEFLGGFK